MEPSIKQLQDLTTSMWKVRTLAAALKLGVFDNLDENTAEEISEKIHTNKDATERLLNALVLMEFLEKNNNKYRNTEVSKKFLAKNSKDYYGNFILMFSEMNEYWKQLDEAVKTGEKVLKQGISRMTNPGFTKAMHNNAITPAKLISEKFDFSDKKHLLDIGGGSGAYCIILTNKFENLKATILEQKEVCETAKQFVEKQGNLDKISFLPGNYFETEYPKNDITLFGQIFHSNSETENKQLVKKAYDSLESNGIMLITEFVLDENKISPEFPVLFSLNMLLQSNGKAYTFSEIKSWLEEAGFKNVKKEHLNGPITLIYAEK